MELTGDQNEAVLFGIYFFYRNYSNKQNSILHGICQNS